MKPINSSSIPSLLSILVVIICLLFSAVVKGQAQETQVPALEIQQPSGGNFTLTKSVVAGGGRHVQNMPSNAHATAGQSVAGFTSQGGQFSLYSGFWTPDFQAPTAACVSISGTIIFGDKGLKKVTVTLTGGNNPAPLETITNARGEFVFPEVEVGSFYVLTVERRGYSFTPNNYSFDLFEERSDISFFALLQRPESDLTEVPDEKP